MADAKQIKEEIATLRKLRDLIDVRLKQLTRQSKYRLQITKSTDGKLYTGVATADIKPYIQEWIDQGYTLPTLADKAMLSETTLLKIMQDEPGSQIRDTTADAIMTALGVTHIYNELVPDPPEGQYWED